MNRLLTLIISILAISPSVGAQDLKVATGDLSRVPGQVGTAMHFDGADDSVTVEDAAALNATDGLTIAFWVKADGWSHQATLLMKAGAFEITKRESPTGMYFWVYLAKHREPINLVWAPEQFNLTANRWYHLAVTYDVKTTEAKAYLDGELQAVDVLRETHPQVGDYRLAHTNAPLMMGLGRRPFHGTMDSVFIYGRALSESQIHRLMEEQKVPNAIGIWTFNENNQRFTRDISGNRLNGRIDRGLSLSSLPELGSRVQVPILHQTPSLTVWRQKSMTKVMNQDIPEATDGEPIEPAVSLAANERESFQIVLRPNVNFTNVSLKASALRQQGGSGVISADQIDLARVEYVPVVKPSDTSVDGTEVAGEAGTMFNHMKQVSPGWYPDPLPPLDATLDLKPNINHAFWITVFAPPGTPAGLYDGTLTITSEGQQPIEIPAQVRVWDFELPKEFHTRNSAYYPARRYPQNPRESYELFSEHHFSMTPLLTKPHVSFSGTDATIDTEAFDREAEIALDELGMNVLYMPGWDLYQMPKAAAAVGAEWNGFTISEKEGELAEPFKQAFGSYLREIARHLKSKGWLDNTRISLVDEPGTSADFSLSGQFADLIRSEAPGVDVMITRWPRPELMGIPDIWSLGFFRHEDMRKAIARGEQLEWYPNWHPLIDMPLMNSRIVGWAMWKHGITGMLIWRVNHGWGSDHEQTWRAPRYDYADGRTIWGNGLLLYPDESFSPVNSIRWETLRDTIEDYEYLQMLRDLCEEAELRDVKADGATAAGRALLAEAVQTIVPHYEAHPDEYRWKSIEWSTDESALLSYRSQIATSIELIRDALAQTNQIHHMRYVE